MADFQVMPGTPEEELPLYEEVETLPPDYHTIEQNIAHEDLLAQLKWAFHKAEAVPPGCWVVETTSIQGPPSARQDPAIENPFRWL